MESFYWVTFAVLVALCGALELSKQREAKVVSNASFKAFRNNYLVVYALMMAGDWLQVEPFDCRASGTVVPLMFRSKQSCSGSCQCLDGSTVTYTGDLRRYSDDEDNCATWELNCRC